MPAVHYALLAGKIALIPVAFVLAIRTPGKPTPVDLMMLVYGLVMGHGLQEMQALRQQMTEWQMKQIRQRRRQIEKQRLHRLQQIQQ